MICNRCKKEIKYVEVGNGYFTNITDCQCGSYYVDIPLDKDVRDIKCTECGEYPFDNEPTKVDSFKKITFKKEENIDDIL